MRGCACVCECVTVHDFGLCGAAVPAITSALAFTAIPKLYQFVFQRNFFGRAAVEQIVEALPHIKHIVSDFEFLGSPVEEPEKDNPL